MQARGRRRDRARMTRKYGLVALPVIRFVGTLYIGWQRHMAVLLEDLVDSAGKLQDEELVLTRFDIGRNAGVEFNARAYGRRAARS